MRSAITLEPETESDPVIQCIHCGAQVPEDSKFCSNCGKTPYPACPKCGAKISGDPRFCNSCGNDLKKLIIPAGTTVIEDKAYEKRGLFEVIIPDGLTSIADYAFANNQLTSVELPEGLTSIADCAFANNQLTSVKLPEGLTSIGNTAFYHNQLTGVKLPEGLTSIADYAFANNQLTGVKLPEGLTSIGDGAFSANKLTSVTLPANLAFDKDCFGKFGESFLDYYTKNGKKADTYTYNAETGGWSAESVNREIAACGEAIRQNPGDPAMYIKRGNIYDGLKNYDLAAADYTEAIRLKPDDAGFFVYRGNAWFNKSDWDKAILDYSEAIRLNPDSAAPLFNRGSAYIFKSGDTKNAYEDFDKARQIDPKFTEKIAVIHVDNAVKFRDNGEFDQALNFYTSAWHLCSSEQMPAMLSGRGWTYYLKGDYEKALADIDESLRLEPGNSDREKRRNEIQAKINEKAARAVHPQAKDLDNLVADKLNEAKAAGKEFIQAAKGIAGLFRKK
ncbi:MAG: leucine-rich repeat protein [Treponema sp.]|nr:leucine-rich repeat protein [Treponema sp.]